MSKSWDQRLCDGALVAFAIWTVLANGTVLRGGTLDQLIQRAGIALALGGLALGIRHVASRKRAPAAPPRLVEPLGTGPNVSGTLRVGALLIAAALAAALVPGAHHVPLWWSAIVLLLVLAFLEIRTQARGPSTPVALAPSAGRQAGWSPALLALSVASVVVSLVLHRFGADDAFYVNLAVAAADAPGWPLLARDTLHGLAEPYPVMPIYMLQSLELLTGALSRVTGIEALRIAHLVIPACAAFLVPLAGARLMRHLAPGRWLACVAVLALIDVCVGDRPRGYGNFGLVHLYHGKAIFRSVGVALLAAYAIEYVRSPSLGRWALLALAQAAAIGLTSSALWIAPAVVGLALLSGASFDRRGLGRVAKGVAASFYPVAAGLWLTTELEQAVTALGPRANDGELFSIAFRDVLGHGPIAVLFVAALVGAWAAAPTRLARRFALVFSLGFLLLFWSPFLAPFLARTVTGNATYWRVFWVLPLPCLVALLLTLPLECRRRAPRTSLLATLGLVLVLCLGPTRYVLSEANRTRLDWPTIKFPPGELATARALVEHTGPGQHVLAPEDISRWLPTLHDHPYPLLVRDAYLDAQVGLLGEDEIRQRKLLTAIAGGATSRNLANKLTSAIGDYALDGVCLSTTVKAGPALRNALSAQGLEQVWSSDEFVIWARPVARRSTD